MNKWHDGIPPEPYCSEWFIAELTITGDRVVLTKLPEEYSYDFKTVDETYYKARRIKKWMQFPDSEYIPYEDLIYNNLNDEIKKLNEQLSRSIELDRQHCNRLQDIVEERNELRKKLEIMVNAAKSCVGYEPFNGLEQHLLSEALKTMNKGIKKE